MDLEDKSDVGDTEKVDISDSESEMLDREILAEKQKIIAIKKRRLAKLKSETARVTREEESEDEFSIKTVEIHRSSTNPQKRR